MSLQQGDIISDSLAFTGIYDLPLSRLVVAMASHGGLMVDVGANLGYFSLLWASQRPGNSVIAFEASPRNWERLRSNVSHNGLQQRIEVRTEAVGHASSSMEFDPGPSEQTGWGRLSCTATASSTRVPVVKLDDVLEDVEKIALLKIDIEGADTWAILGSERLLKERRIANVCWEEHKSCMRELGIREGDARRLLKDLGYKAVPQGDPHAECVAWYANRAT